MNNSDNLNRAFLHMKNNTTIPLNATVHANTTYGANSTINEVPNISIVEEQAAALDITPITNLGNNINHYIQEINEIGSIEPVENNGPYTINMGGKRRKTNRIKRTRRTRRTRRTMCTRRTRRTRRH